MVLFRGPGGYGIYEAALGKWVLLGVGVPLLAVLFLTSGVFVWSPLNCRHEEIDIRSGRVRYVRYWLYCRVSERVEETWLSRAADRPQVSPDWRRVNTFSPGVGYSPHHRFHGATAQIQELKLVEGLVPFKDAARRKAAQTVLKLWQKEGGYSGAGSYITELHEVVSELETKGAESVKVKDVPEG